MKNYPAVRICLLFMSGIILQKLFAIDTNALFFLFLIIFLISILIFFTNKALDLIHLFTSSLLILLTGAVSFNIYQSELKPYPFKVSRLKNVTIYGEIKSVELKRDFEVKFMMDTDSLLLNSKTYAEKFSVICRIRDENRQNLDSLYEKLKAGDCVSLRGTFSKGREKRNPGEFDFQKYLEDRGISAIQTAYSTEDFRILKSAEKGSAENYIFNLRKGIDNVFYRYNSKDCAAFLRGFLLADRNEIGEDVQADFINTGVVHILAVSGSNVLLIILIFTLILGRFTVVIRSVITLLGLFFFLMITDTSPSVLRAVIMGSTAIIVLLSNRSYNVFNELAIAALIILCIFPGDLFDSGFQLSFSAVLSIAVIYPHLKSLLDKMNIESRFIYKTLLFLAVTLAAEIGVLPFTLYYFGKVSVVSLPANLLVIPLAAVISYLGIVTLTLSFIFPWLAQIYAGVNNLLTDILLFITHGLSSLRHSYLSFSQFSFMDLIFSYAFMCSFFLLIRKLNSLKAKVIASSLTLFNIILFCSIDNRSFFPDNKLSIMAVDVGQGDATLVRFPNGRTLLIDAGSAADYFDSGEEIILPLLERLGIEKIDYGFISHVDSDHYSGFFSLVRKGMIRKMFKPEVDRSYPKDLRLERFLRHSKVPILYYRKGCITFGNAKLYVLNTKYDRNIEALNDRSGIIKITYGRTSLLFEGDAGRLKEDLISEKYGNFLKSDLLKMGHHGSRYSSSRMLLSFVRPAFGLISAGVQNRYGHPSKEVLERSRQFNVRLLRTDLEGALFLQSDGEKISLVNWKD